MGQQEDTSPLEEAITLNQATKITGESLYSILRILQKEDVPCGMYKGRFLLSATSLHAVYISQGGSEEEWKQRIQASKEERPEEWTQVAIQQIAEVDRQLQTGEEAGGEKLINKIREAKQGIRRKITKKLHKAKRGLAESLSDSQAAYELNISNEEFELLCSSGLVKPRTISTREGIEQLQETSVFNAYLLLRMVGLTQVEDARVIDFLKTATTYYESRYRADETKDQVRDLIKIFGETEIDYWALREKLRARGAKNLDEAIRLSKIAFVIRNEHIPGYQLIKYLGEGKSRRVYLARIKNSKALVKIKIYQPTTESRQQIERRKRKSLSKIVREEFATLLKFEHYSGVTTYFDYGPRGLRRFFGRQCYIVGEYIVGQNLEEAAPTLTTREKLRIFCEIANTVKDLHQIGYVIRDLKLDNIMLSEDKREVKIDDLEMITGLADILTGKAFGSTRGSDRYAAPELIRGERATIGTDMYALAACLFYLLEGKQRASGFEDANYLPRKPYENFLGQQLVKLVDRIRTNKGSEMTIMLTAGGCYSENHLANIVYYLRKNLSYAPQERGEYGFEELDKEGQKYVMEWIEKIREGNNIPFQLPLHKPTMKYTYI